MAFASATVRLFQDASESGVLDAGGLVLTVNCTCSPADGQRVCADLGIHLQLVARGSGWCWALR